MIHAHVAVAKNINIVMENRTRFSFLAKGGIILVFLTTAISSTAQVQVNEEPEISELMEQYIRNNFDTPIIRAWRIQIATTNDRSVMEESIDNFEELYPDIKYNWQHNPPYYQVRIGAFEKREDLEAFLLRLKEDFPAAIPVQDDIEKREIIYN